MRRKIIYSCKMLDYLQAGFEYPEVDNQKKADGLLITFKLSNRRNQRKLTVRP
ncbi:hypothetical protein SERLA73DRAFT_183971 [Serpula lacrymans var. lacrymans S7.3]|uniref:Uncharacterized protein n=1 Tax=Serpula lacrymans var. lacrymans (strain S7.3) TaxID=936435 RepID=F8Q285_SERL3|nr:hypothetical protein SERLA73DRAFT_183971 [Serpula lacrymans var. lacrymans S7.3]